MTRRVLRWMGVCCAGLCITQGAWAFCGFYVSSAGADLFNNRSEIIAVREDNRTTLNLAFDYKGAPEQFALVMPVPQVLGPEDVRVVKRKHFENLDMFTAPRLVEYHAGDPCPEGRYGLGAKGSGRGGGGAYYKNPVTVLSAFSVEEYDVVVLDAEQSNGLEDWLNANNYHIPEGAAPYFTPYIEKGLYFFVVKVDLSRLPEEDIDRDEEGNVLLRPLQIGFEAEQLMIPIQLGKINAPDEQHLIVYIISSEGRFRAANYPNMNVPTGHYVPASFKTQPQKLARFYQDVVDVRFDAHPESVLTEYAWNLRKCDPCPRNQPTTRDLEELGVSSPSQAIITRLHARYTRDSMTQDLIFERAPHGDTQYQARYVIQHPWNGDAECLTPEDRKAWVQHFKLKPQTRQDKRWLRAIKKDPGTWGPAWVSYQRERLERAADDDTDSETNEQSVVPPASPSTEKHTSTPLHPIGIGFVLLGGGFWYQRRRRKP